MRILAFAVWAMVASQDASAQQAECSDDGWCEVYRLPAAQSRSGGWIGSIWGSGPNDIFVAGRYTIARFDGAAWTLQPNQSASAIFDLFGVSATEVYAVGSYRTIQRWNGREWVLQHRDIGAGLRGGVFSAVFRLPTGHLIVWDSYSAWRLEAGTWTQIFDGRVDHWVDDLRRRYPSVLYPVEIDPCPRAYHMNEAAESTYVIRCDGGNAHLWRRGSWADLGSPSGRARTLRSAVYLRDDLIFIGEHRGRVQRYDGSAWHLETTPATRDVRGFWSDGTWLYAVAHNRVIRRRLPGS